ncbi:MAG: carboxynorspermidine decarboxylase [Agathobaculum sp.]|uniref:carboxynorspermidine decarboxylase n=1 Tax=Agathobaculum sp. TaxID=2048138 RepID=UPI0025C4BFBB|nr:carboxynorspermidine decarboxylase [Agathobaculum sp.]MCI7125645.1 carboxynorspermidine decarboxylase [Agathobaculum sp.]MDY3712213.1 carboxynorspermidine decarboxylase [Agathobaculum sp.]
MRFTELPTPCFIVDENRLVQNLAVLRDVMERTGAKILLAQKAFSMFSVYPLLREYLSGSTASGLFEARLGHEEFGGETHVYAPAYPESEFRELLGYVDHVVFNSFAQWKKFGNVARAAGKSCGLRVNPECSTQPAEHALYDPCGPTSRLGITLDNFQPDLLDGVEGLHFHTLCEQNADDLVRTVAAFEQRFGAYMEDMKWLNLGGGHHITRDDYDVETLVQCILRLRDKYGVQIYLEPGEAVVLNAGWLVAGVLEVMRNHADIAILDTSAACHMPDVLEMPYRPPVYRAGEPGQKAFTYQLTGRSCLAGDVIGTYSFDNMLRPGDQVVFEDMALYTMVKTNTFNGVPLPCIGLRRANGTDEVVRVFGYEDFKHRLS